MLSTYPTSALSSTEDYSSSTWLQVGADIFVEFRNDYSGRSGVAMSSDGSVLAVGAAGNDGNGSNAGHVRVLKNVDGSWLQLGEDIDGEGKYDSFGDSISLSCSDGIILAVGATGNDGNGSNSGHIRVFENVNGSWVQVGTDIDGEYYGDLSGGSVPLSSDGSILAVGAIGNDGNGNSAGHVRVYKNVNGCWVQIGGDIDGENTQDPSGSSVALSSDGNVLAVGAPFNSNYSGHVRVFQLEKN